MQHVRSMSNVKDPAGGRATLLPPHLLDRLGGLELVARTVVQGFVAGLHRSPYRGAGREFAGHRAYQQGDDLRHIDWRLFGRSDRLFVREFREDANLQAVIVVDASLSMGYAEPGGIPKLRYAAILAAALAHIMLPGTPGPAGAGRTRGGSGLRPPRGGLL